jgi:hypothetical protein
VKPSAIALKLNGVKFDFFTGVNWNRDAMGLRRRERRPRRSPRASPLLQFLLSTTLLQVFFSFERHAFPVVASSTLSISDPTRVYMAVICGRYDCSRGRDAYYSWGRSFRESWPGSTLRFFMADSVAFFAGFGQTVPVRPGWDFGIPARHCFWLDLASAHHFLENTSLMWYIRTTYDTYVHLPNLGDLMDDLNARYLPVFDIVMKGEALSIGKTLEFVHGGPGWIMSRAAAAKFVAHEHAMIEMHTNLSVGDDVIFSKFAVDFGLRPEDIFSPRFCGAPLDAASWKLFNDTRKFDGLDVMCPLEPLAHPLLRVTQLVFLHNGQKTDWVNPLGEWLITEAPDNLYIEAVEHEARFCWIDDRHRPYLKVG